MRQITILLIISIVISAMAMDMDLTVEELLNELTLALNERDYDRTIELVSVVEEKYPTEPDLVEVLLTVYLIESDRDKFTAKVDEMISLHPDDPRWLMYKAQSVIDKTNPTTYDDAVELLITAEEISPEDPTVFFFHGYVEMMRDDYASAKPLFETALQLNEETNTLEEINKAEIYYNLACIYAGEGDPDTSVDFLTKVFEIEPQFVQYSQGDSDLESLMDYQPYKDAIEKYGEEVSVDEYPPTVLVGEVAPDFELQQPEGDIHKLSDYEGTVVLLNFWATWCPPCKMEIPDISDLYTEYKERGLVVIGVSMDDPVMMDDETLLTTSDELGINYIILRGDEEVGLNYISAAEYAIPQTYIIDRDGVVVDFVVGLQDKATFVEMVEPYL